MEFNLFNSVSRFYKFVIPILQPHAHTNRTKKKREKNNRTDGLLLFIRNCKFKIIKWKTHCSRLGSSLQSARQSFLWHGPIHFIRLTSKLDSFDIFYTLWVRIYISLALFVEMKTITIFYIQIRYNNNVGYRRRGIAPQIDIQYYPKNIIDVSK